MHIKLDPELNHIHDDAANAALFRLELREAAFAQASIDSTSQGRVHPTADRLNYNTIYIFHLRSYLNIIILAELDVDTDEIEDVNIL